MTDQPQTIEDIEAALAAAMPAPEPPFPGDPDATWDYWSGLANPPEGPSDALVWARLRYRRDQALRDSDHRLIEDVPGDKQAWKAYRKALRDLPDTTTDPRQVVWPTPPEDTDAR